MKYILFIFTLTSASISKAQQIVEATVRVNQPVTCNILSVLEPNGHFKVYPNPATHHLTVDCITKNTTGKLISIEGKIVREWHLTYGVNHFEISEIQPGIYFLILKSDKYEESIKIRIK
jgi:DNA replicative helicase MCM subunit Mcm2 (Cdc46/Mcm family)